jgi:hypothetical protein
MNVQRLTVIHKSEVEERLSTRNVTLLHVRASIVTMEKQYLLHIASVCVFKDIYCKESMYSMFKDKIQNCSLNQFE